MIKRSIFKKFFDVKTLSFYVLILLVAFTLRFYELTLRPVHHDEAVRAIIALRVFRGEAWEYDPGYHGPFLMYLTALAFKIFGVNNFSLRVGEAFFGFLTILLLIPIRGYLGKRGFLFSSALLALSPAFVTYSKMAIQTPLVVFFELATFISVFLYSKTHKPKFAYLTAVSLALGFTVKENMYISVGLFGPYLTVRFLESLVKRQKGVKNRILLVRLNIISWVKRLYKNCGVILVSFILFAAFHLTLFSSFGKNTENIKKAVIEPFTFWYDRVQYRHTKPWNYYVGVLGDAEYILVVFGVLGIIQSIVRRNEFGILLSYWAVVSYVVYSFGVYFKEPWLIPHFILPLFMLSGLSAEGLFKEVEVRWKQKGLILLTLILFVCVVVYAYISYEKNFVSYWMESNKLTYVQNYPDVDKLVSKIQNISYQKTDGNNIDIVYAFDENYPFVWHWRDYKNVKYYKNPVGGIEGWNGTVWNGEGLISWADDQHLSGKRSVKISSPNGADASWLQLLSATGGDRYVLSGWIKTENVQNINASKVAQVFVRGGSNKSPILGESKSIEGTHNWTYFNVTFTLPSHEDSIRINLALAGWGFARGTVWFDNLSLTGTDLTNADFEEGRNDNEYPSVYIISDNFDYSVDPEFASRYVREVYEIRPRIHISVYFRKDILS